MKKRLAGCCAVITAAMLMLTPLTAMAGTIYVDGEKVETAAGSVVINDSTMVPLRAVAEMMGCRVEWIGEQQKIEIYAPETDQLVLVLGIDEIGATKHTEDEDGEMSPEAVELVAAPTIIDGSTYVPLRFIAETLNYEVAYNEETKAIALTTEGFEGEPFGDGSDEEEAAESAEGEDAATENPWLGEFVFEDDDTTVRLNVTDDGEAGVTFELTIDGEQVAEGVAAHTADGPGKSIAELEGVVVLELDFETKTMKVTYDGADYELSTADSEDLADADSEDLAE